MQEYHHVWLSAHPWRTEEWLKKQLSEGFDIHHIDGDHSNNDPGNLVLIDHADHMMLHSGKRALIRVWARRATIKPKALYSRRIGPMPHWRRGGIPKKFTLEWNEARKKAA